MGLYEVFFPEIAQADHLSNIAQSQQRSLRLREDDIAQVHRSARDLNFRVADLENDVGTMALFLAAILKTLEEKETLTREDLKKTLEELDLLDNIRDGKIDVEDLRKGKF